MLIGLSGYAGSGKSTAADMMFHLGWARRKFAGPLKEMMYALFRSFGLSDVDARRMIEGDLKETPTRFLGGNSPRYAMQTLGTDWGRALLHEDFWAEVAMAKVEPMTVFDDCRFENEAAAIRERGGIIVRVVRPNVGPVNSHVSENLPEPDFVIDNSGDMDHLEQQVRWITLKTTR